MYLSDFRKQNEHKSYWLYILYLEDDCIYVGITSRTNPYFRINEHKIGTGSKWTKQHAVKRVLKINNLGRLKITEARKIENQVTLEYMLLYGHNKVRGGYMCYTGRYIKLKNGYMLRAAKSIKTLAS